MRTEARRDAVHVMHKLFALIFSVLFVVTSATSAGFSQGLVTEPMRVGVILPESTGGETTAGVLLDAVVEAAVKGTTMATEETAFNASMLGMDFDSIIVHVEDAAAAAEAAARLVAEENVYAIIGGIGDGFAVALSQAAVDNGVLFFNIGTPDDYLRREVNHPNTFHIEASSAMYLDALAGWFVRAPHRRWFIVYEDSPAGEALYRRLQVSLTERHFGAREVGRAAVAAGQSDYRSVMNSIRRSNPDVVVMLLNAVDQLAFVEQYAAAGMNVRITGFPAPETQTRTYFRLLAERAGGVDAGYRTLLWEPSLEQYGARELNARYMSRWGEPMDSAAWAAYASIKILFETVMFGGSLDTQRMVEHLSSPVAVFDVWKGIGTSFRPWDHQLRQSLFLVRVDQQGSAGDDVRAKLAMARLVGELPAIYMPGTDPVERLDQLGDV